MGSTMAGREKLTEKVFWNLEGMNLETMTDGEEDTGASYTVYS